MAHYKSTIVCTCARITKICNPHESAQSILLRLFLCNASWVIKFALQYSYLFCCVVYILVLPIRTGVSLAAQELRHFRFIK
jgi:hypothetical protein